jgi:hypothetical protein
VLGQLDQRGAKLPDAADAPALVAHIDNLPTTRRHLTPVAVPWGGRILRYQLA